MKRKQKKSGIFTYSGISIEDDIKLNCQNEHSSKWFFLLRTIIAFFSTIFTTTMAKYFVDVDVSFGLFWGISILSVFSFSAIISKNKFVKSIGIFIATIEILFIFVKFSDIKTGFYVYWAGYMEKADMPNSLGHYINGIDRLSMEYYSDCFSVALTVIISLGSVISCVYRIDFPLLFIFTFPIFELGMYWGLEAPTLVVIGLFVCWIIILSMQAIHHITNKAGRGNTFAVHERKKSFYLTSPKIKSQFYTVFIKFVFLVTVGTFCIITFFTKTTGFVRTEKMDELRTNISKAVSDFSTLNLKTAFADYEGGLDFFGVKTVGGTNGGNLGENEGISFNGSTALKIEVPYFNYTMYLRGYVAGEYDNNKWNPIPEDTESSFIDKFSNENLWPQDLNYAVCLHKEIYGDESPLTANNANIYTTNYINISIKGASKKFLYAPYATLYTSTDDGTKKMSPYNESYVSSYTENYEIPFLNFTNIADNWEDISDTLQNIDTNFTGELYEAYTEYTEYVNNNYLETENLSSLKAAYKEICNEYLAKYSDNGRLVYQPSYNEIYNAIKEYFSDNFTYTLNPGKTPDGEDFIDYFLTEQKEGYCSYFATTGVQLLRMFNFPARYVEGYMVLPSQMSDKADGNGNYKITVLDKSAHAWAEVYIENVGWIPAEFTPGYIGGDNPNLTYEEKNSKNSSNSDSSSNVDFSSSKNEVLSSDTKSSKNDESSQQSKNKNSSKNDNDSSNSNKTNNSKNSNDSTVRSDSESYIDTINPNNDITNGHTALKYVIGIICILIIIFSVLFINWIIKVKKFKEKCTNKDFNQRVVDIYKYMIRYLSFADVKCSENVTDFQLAQILYAKCKEKNIEISEEYLFRITDIALKGFMSDGEVTQDEAEEAMFILNEIAMKAVKPKLSAINKFTTKFIYGLY